MTSDRENWHKSSYSKGGMDNCVEVCETAFSAAVRDTMHREHGHLAFAPTEWSAFLTDVKARAL
jgi:hypothetical protein